MTASQNVLTTSHTVEVVFAGDGVSLSGRIDYPETPFPTSGYPLVFVLSHAGCNSIQECQHYAEIGLPNGYAVFRWDRRGTGRSGAGGRGSTTQDAVNAYKTALKQEHINHRQTVIIAQNCATKLLGTTFGLFARVQMPYGVTLVGNQLDETDITAITTQLHIVQAQDDWNDPEQYAEIVCETHRAHYKYGASFYVAEDADRKLIDNRSGKFHRGALKSIGGWLEGLQGASV